MNKFPPVLQGECVVCVGCELPIVGDIIHLGGGSPMCKACAEVVQVEYDEWVDEHHLPVGVEAYDDSYDYTH